MVQPEWKTVWRFLEKLKIEPYDPAVLLLGVQPKEMCSSVDEWIKKVCCVCVCVCVCIKFSHEKKKILPLVTTWMDLEGIMINKKSKTEKDKYCIVSFIWGT